jgi:hypothetical protein
MTLAVVRSRALDGMAAREVRVEVHLANGLPGFALVGLADTEVKESRERVRAALAETGFAFPHNRRITVSLAPADLPKEWLLQTECRLCKQSAHFAQQGPQEQGAPNTHVQFGPFLRWHSPLRQPMERQRRPGWRSPAPRTLQRRCRIPPVRRSPEPSPAI